MKKKIVNNVVEQFNATQRDTRFLKAAKNLTELQLNNLGKPPLTQRISPLLSESVIGRLEIWANPEAVENGTAGKKKHKDKTTGVVVGGVDCGFEQINRDRFALLDEPLQQPLTYYLLGKLMGEGPPVTVADKFCGKYYYYRFVPIGSGADAKLVYKMGQIQIKTNKDRTLTEVWHWSHDFDLGENGKPKFSEDIIEHKGLCYHFGDRLVMIMFREGVLRLATAIVRDNDISKPIDGLVQTILKEYDTSIFGAHFVMIKCDEFVSKTSNVNLNQALLEKFSDELDSDGSHFITHLNKSIPTQFGVLVQK